jgi:hypothetical protein
MMEDGNREELEAARCYITKDVDWSKYKKILPGPVVLLGKRTDSWKDVFNIIDY